MVKRLSNIFLLVTALLLVGCTINYDDESASVEKSDLIPDSVMKNFTLVQMKNNEPYTEINSTLAEIYDSQDKTVLHNVTFTEYNTNDNTVATYGTADFIEYYNDTEDAKLSGNLNFISTSDELEMTGEDLYWDKKDKIISSEKNSSIKIVQDDGSGIEGYGFSANLRNSTFSFEKDITGFTK